MNGLTFLIPIALLMGVAGLAAFLWAMSNGQFDDPDGAAMRILIDDEDKEREERHDRAA
ncbi:MAG: cbb3-type cytochrome oxidase assembly protein CcoS [Sphingobium sp.]|mgnify:CR=1 FL=1|nr:cbb3-type cytochrome oxidase assembly protein CcoS [Sphingobium sp.]MCP5399654.1 cbb3-type cytochrome oxidase assembly protein CcoS [Sphingomonas sp.]